MRQLRTYHRPNLHAPRMVLGFSGWMDGGDVSTGTVDYLRHAYNAEQFAEIQPEDFYIYNFPGSMEITAMFRPHARIEDGLVHDYREPRNRFFCCPEQDLILFKGKEPNMRWDDFASCILGVAEDLGVTEMCFVGSVGGLAPHTRDPRFFGSVSDANRLGLLDRHHLVPSEYEGPASLVTYLMVSARERGLAMESIVAEIPAYFQGRNGRCIAAAVAKVAAILGIPVDSHGLNAMALDFEERLTESVEAKPDLAELIRKMERDYDGERLSEEDDEDLREWFEKHGPKFD